MDTPTHPPRTDPALRLGELADAAGVSVRTVRYYIAEGLLPPPLGAGPHAAYTPAHLDRLRLIGRMKDAYLPLREIRRRLDGLDDDAVRETLAEWTGGEDHAFSGVREDAQPAAFAAPRDSAADYVARLQAAPASAAPSRRGGSPPPHAAPVSVPRSPPFPQPPARAAPAAAPEPAAWRRVPISAEAELLIREDAYHRRKDRVEWLVEWARKVFG